MAGAAQAALCACGPDAATPTYWHLSSRDPSPVAVENERPGSPDWALKRPASHAEVAAYTSRVSVLPGESFDVHVTVSEAHPVIWDLYRLGYYQGLGARRVQQGGPIAVSPQKPCPVDPTTGLVECQWAPTFHIQTTEDWVSGYYLLRVRRDDGFDAYAPLILTERSPSAPVLVQASVTTWQAYNLWGGMNLYSNHLPAPKVYTGPRAFKVSFDRPLYNSSTADELGAGPMLRWERPLVAWLERRGYDVAYTTNVTVHQTPRSLRGRRLFISVGHDEYWSTQERAAIDTAHDAEVSLAFLSANVDYWRIRLEPSSRGAPDRVIACYKGDPSDPRSGQPDETTRFRAKPYPEPENGLVGVMYETYTPFDGFPFIVSKPEHWLFSGTGLAAQDTLGNLVGYEWDHVFSNGASPPGLEIVAASEAFGVQGVPAPHDATVYYPTPRSFVFGAGTVQFSWGLGRPGYVNGQVQQIVDNLLVRAGVEAQRASAYDPVPLRASLGSASAVFTLAGGSGRGYRDGPAMAARFDHPAGVAVTGDGVTYVADTLNHRIRAVSADGIVTTLAGCGPSGAETGSFKDGSGAGACFNLPTGLALGEDGALYVADTGNHRIRRVARGGSVSTYAGSGALGATDAAPLDATFSHPEGIAFGPDGALYVADSENGAVRRIEGSAVTTVARKLPWPTGLAVGGDGTVYISVSGEGRLYALSGDRLEVLANSAGVFGDSDGAAAAARLRPANGIALLGRSVVFSDSANNTVRRLDLDAKTVTRLAGTGRSGDSLTDGAHAELVVPRGLATSAGRITVADSGNHRVVVIEP